MKQRLLKRPSSRLPCFVECLRLSSCGRCGRNHSLRVDFSWSWGFTYTSAPRWVSGGEKSTIQKGSAMHQRSFYKAITTRNLCMYNIISGQLIVCKVVCFAKNQGFNMPNATKYISQSFHKNSTRLTNDRVELAQLLPSVKHVITLKM